MKKEFYLLDTHALIFWSIKESVSNEFIEFFDKQEKNGHLFVSSISFWEVALLVKRGKIEISDVQSWKSELICNTNLKIIDPSASEVVDSTLLPEHHTDIFDRLLIAHAKARDLVLVTKDTNILKYEISTIWI